MSGQDEYGIIANVFEADSCFRMGAKAWIAGGTGGEGWERFEWLAITRGGRSVVKWTTTTRFHNFRCAWVPKHLRERVWYIRGSRGDMEKMAEQLNAYADERRAAHPNRFRFSAEPPADP